MVCMSPKWFVSRSYGLALMFVGALVSIAIIFAAALMYLPIEAYYFITGLIRKKNHSEPNSALSVVNG